jgi:Tripartite tricarboxylate transporter family receptor
MKLPRRNFLRLAAGAAALPALSRIARAQIYPVRPITMIVPFAAGGPNDGIARIMAERMRVLLGQPVLIENVDGAAGSIGTGRAARAAPDGYTISIGYWGTHVANAAIYVLDFDVVKDFEPISLLVESPLLIAASKATPASDLREFVNWLRANPDKASAAVPGSAPTSPAFSFRGKPARASVWCHIAVPDPLSRTWRKGGSTWRYSMPERRCRMCVRASSRPTPFPPSVVLLQRPVFQQLMRRDFRISMRVSGLVSGRRRGRRRTSSPSSMPQP